MLTDTNIKSLKPAPTAKKYADGGGLFLYVTPKGSKLWRMSYRFENKQKTISFGEYPLITLKRAREKRDEVKTLLQEGIDPVQQKKNKEAERQAREVHTFKNIALEWHESQTRHILEAGRTYRRYLFEQYIFPHIGNRPIAEIEAAEVLQIIKPLELADRVNHAHVIKQLCGRVFRYAIATSRAKHDVTAYLRGAIRPKRVKHHPTILDRDKIGKLLVDLESYPGYYPVICALKLMPLVFVREKELIWAEWSEIDFENALWRIPASRMKRRKQHLVPLATQVITILKELHNFSGNGKYLFPSARLEGKPIQKSTMLAALRRKGYTTDEMSIHGFRGMASTLLNEMGFNGDWIERQLAHDQTNSVRAAYNHAQYLEERRTMMQAWADHVFMLKDKAKIKQINEQYQVYD